MAGAVLPEELDQQNRFSGIKCVIKGVDCLIDMRRVVEVIEDKQVTQIPGTVNWIEGVMNYRGALVPVYNTHRYLQLPDKADKTSAKQNGPLIVVRSKGELCSLRVNRVTGMQKFMDEDFKPAGDPEAGEDTLERYVDSSIAAEDQAWSRVDIDRLLGVITRVNPREPQTVDTD